MVEIRATTCESRIVRFRLATPLVAATALLAAVLLVAGCGKSKPSSNGESDKTATQILADAKAAAVAATAVHVSGSGLSSGSPLTLDLQLVAGQGGMGHITASGLSFDVIRIGRKAYFKGAPAFWKHFGGAAAAQLFKGKWLEASSTKGDLASFTPLTDIGKLTSGTLGSHGTLKKGAETTIGGQPVIALVDTTKGGTLYIATTGTPYPIELKGGKTDKGKITFDQWDQPVTLAAPKGAIDYSKLTG
jgi:hypothetical protein